MTNIMLKSIPFIEETYIWPNERPKVPVEISDQTKQHLWADISRLAGLVYLAEVPNGVILKDIAKAIIATCIRNGYDAVWIPYEDPTPSTTPRTLDVPTFTATLMTTLHKFMLQDGIERANLFELLHICHMQISYAGGKLSELLDD